MTNFKTQKNMSSNYKDKIASTQAHLEGNLVEFYISRISQSLDKLLPNEKKNSAPKYFGFTYSHSNKLTSCNSDRKPRRAILSPFKHESIIFTFNIPIRRWTSSYSTAYKHPSSKVINLRFINRHNHCMIKVIIYNSQ